MALHDAWPALDQRFARLHDETRVPGVAWGVVIDGALAHAGGAGTIRDGEAVPPDADSIFRIASMTKSFTAASILLLRDEGRLRLDDPAADHVPQLAGWRGPTRDSRPITIRDLLTMSAGLATDDPWGDRQQALPLDEFATLLGAGPTFAWPPGLAFEYSNLGYGILGRVVSAASGREYREFVTDRLLAPLGMTSTGFRQEDLPPDRLARGYVRRDEALVEEGGDGYGALASMGGVWSSVRDLATWVTGFLDAFPARDDPDGTHPLTRASRREMQQIHRVLPGVVDAHGAHEAPVGESLGYGFGLFIVSATDTGQRVGHGGGYPGFGSYMTWHPATGIGIVALGNLRYAPVYTAAIEQLAVLVRAGAARRRPPRRLPAVERARVVVERLLDEWDDAVADEAFAMNMDLDEPRDARRAAAARLAAELGPLRRDDTRPDTSDTPAHLDWWLRGERGWVRASILISPEPAPRLQSLALTAVPDPSPRLRATAQRLLAAAGSWPAEVEAAPALDREIAVRSLRAAAARFGPMTAGLPTAGNGTTTATFEIVAEARSGADAATTAVATIAVTIDAETDAVTAMAVRVTRREVPVETW